MTSHPLDQELHTRLLGAEERANDMSQRMDNAIRNLVGLAAAMRQLNGKADEMQARMDTFAASLDLLTSAPAVGDEQVNKLFDLLQGSEERIIELGIELAEIKEGLAQQPDSPVPTDPQTNLHAKSIAALEKELGDLKSNIRSASEKQVAARESDSSAEQLTALRSEMEALRAELSGQKHAQQNESKGDSTQTQLQIAALREDLNELHIQATQINELRARTKELERLADRMKELEARQAAASADAQSPAASKPVASRESEVDDPSIKPLLESALHIQRGDIASAVAELEKASQLSDNPKLAQALVMARKMLADQKGS